MYSRAVKLGCSRSWHAVNFDHCSNRDVSPTASVSVWQHVPRAGVDSSHVWDGAVFTTRAPSQCTLTSASQTATGCSGGSDRHLCNYRTALDKVITHYPAAHCSLLLPLPHTHNGVVNKQDTLRAWGTDGKCKLFAYQRSAVISGVGVTIIYDHLLILDLFFFSSSLYVAVL